jgi:hypothetical protein
VARASGQLNGPPLTRRGPHTKFSPEGKVLMVLGRRPSQASSPRTRASQERDGVDEALTPTLDLARIEFLSVTATRP